MAKNKNVVYLAFEDEEITLKHRSLMNSTVNKVGGQPDWPAGDIKVPNCPLCKSLRPLLIQLYAPLDNSQFHRTLYIFACLNPACSNSSKGWTCLRTQNLDMQNTKNTPAGGKEKKSKTQPAQQMTWCSGADDWGDDVEEPNQNQMNMNFVNTANFKAQSEKQERINNMENDVIRAMDGMRMYEQNANCEKAEEDHNVFEMTNVCAVIEGQDSSPVLVEEPIVPERDLMALFKGSTTSEHRFKDPTLRSFFLAVEQEQELTPSTNYYGLSDHVRYLYQKYQELNEMEEDSSNESQMSGSGGDARVTTKESEMYEKAVPAHGDLMFHNFLSAIQRNPGQLIRYSRDSEPLLIAPFKEPIPKCQYCGRDTVCEVQILSTLIPKLQLQQTSDQAPIEYGNVLVFTCLNSCWDISDNMRFESVIVQKEI